MGGCLGQNLAKKGGSFNQSLAKTDGNNSQKLAIITVLNAVYFFARFASAKSQFIRLAMTAPTYFWRSFS